MKFSFFFSVFLLFFAGFSFAVPSVSIVSPANDTYYNRSILLNATVTDAFLDKCAFSLDGWATNVTFNCSWVRFNASNGSSTVRVRANDTSGGINDSEFVSFTVQPRALDYSIPSPGTGVRDAYVYDAGANLTALSYSIPDASVWVKEAYVYSEGANVSILSYPVTDAGVWVVSPYFYNETEGASSSNYDVPSTGLWAVSPYFYNATTGVSFGLYPIPATGLEVVIRNLTACNTGNDCAGMGNLCINGTCRGLTASGSDIGAKCSVDSVVYNLTGYTWSAGGCSVASQSKSVHGIGTFTFNNVKVGIRAFRAFFESDPANSTYTYYLVVNENTSDNFANVQLVVFVNSSSARTIRGELVG